MFKDTLRELVDGLEGGIAAVVMDGAGIALESYGKERHRVRHPDHRRRVRRGHGLGAARAGESLSAGNAEEVLIRTEKLVTILRKVNETYFLALAMAPDSSLGKGRYMMRTAAPKLLADM